MRLTDESVIHRDDRGFEQGICQARGERTQHEPSRGTGPADSRRGLAPSGQGLDSKDEGCSTAKKVHPLQGHLEITDCSSQPLYTKVPSRSWIFNKEKKSHQGSAKTCLNSSSKGKVVHFMIVLFAD